MEQLIIKGKYIIHKQIGQGKFGKVYSGLYIKNNKHVAIKVEYNETLYQTLKHEACILNHLNSNKCKYIPLVYWYGVINNYKTLIIPYYNCSLYEYIKIKQISISQINNIMIQMIHILESIHKYGVIHRDIKPHNFMVKSGEIYLIDFGLSTFYIDDAGKHIHNNIKDTIIGSPNYISYHIHNGETPSRRDDLISIGYLYIYLIHKTLLWENLNIILSKKYNETHILNEKNIKRKELKHWDNIQHICKNTGFQNQIYQYLHICYFMEYNETPMYNHMIDLFQLCLSEL